MKCAACGYSDAGDPIQGRRHDRVSDGSRPFVVLSGCFHEFRNGDGGVRDEH